MKELVFLSNKKKRVTREPNAGNGQTIGFVLGHRVVESEYKANDPEMLGRRRINAGTCGFLGTNKGRSV